MRIVLLLFIALLAGCGQRGSLYLPDEGEGGTVVEQPADPAAGDATGEDDGEGDEREAPDDRDDGPANP